MKRNLRNKIITWSFVPTAIILVAVTLTSLYTYQQVTENLVIVRDRELTRLGARLLAADLASYSDPWSDQYRAVFDGMVVFNANGKVMFAEPEEYESWTPKWFNDVSLYDVLHSSKPVYSDVMEDKSKGENLVVVVMPLTGSDGQSLGGIAGLFRLDPTSDSRLFESIEKLRRGESNCIYLVDGSGHVIYHSNPDYIGKDFSKQTVVESVLEGWAGSYRTQDFEGQEIVASFSPVPGTTWGLVTEESWAALTQTSRRYSKYLLLLLAVGIVAPTLIATIGVRRITRPIADLIGAAQEIASGHFGRRIHANTGDELEQLAEQFNIMAAQLQESYSDLERKVEDRTKELATLNTIAAEVSQTLDLEQILGNALDEVLQVMNMKSGQAFRLEAETQTLVSMAHQGLSEEFVRQTAQMPVTSSIAGRAVAKGQPVIMRVHDYPEGDMRNLVQQAGLQLVVCIPLIVHRKAVGTLHLGTGTPRCITSEELSLLAAIGHQIGVAMENARLYEQAQQLAVMKERNRLARDLHDSVTQALYGVTLYSEAALRQLQLGQTDMAIDHMQEIRATAQESLREMRLLIFELRLPMLKQEGLAGALQARLEAVESRVGLETKFRSDVDGQLSPELEEGLYRIAQEALNNALRHARARSVSVCLHRHRQAVTMEIRDDGVGFDPTTAREQGGFGLHSMEQRAAKLGGELSLESSPGEGTTIRVEVRR